MVLNHAPPTFGLPERVTTIYMNSFKVSFTKSRAQLVELEVEDGMVISIGKDARSTGWVYGEDGTIEARLFGKYVFPTMFKPAVGFNEADALSKVEEMARQAVSGAVPRVVIVRCGELRGYFAVPIFMDPKTGEGIDDAYCLTVPALRIGPTIKAGESVARGGN